MPFCAKSTSLLTALCIVCACNLCCRRVGGSSPGGVGAGIATAGGTGQSQVSDGTAQGFRSKSIPGWGGWV